MYRKIILMLILTVLLQADKIEIKSKIFEANRNNQVGIFSGGVEVRQGNDYLKCSKLKVILDKKNKITAYNAILVSDFSIKMNNNNFSGRANEIHYDVLKNTYELKGKVRIKENAKELEADYIIIDQKTGIYKIKSTEKNKPVKLIFEVSR